LCNCEKNTKLFGCFTLSRISSTNWKQQQQQQQYEQQQYEQQQYEQQWRNSVRWIKTKRSDSTSLGNLLSILSGSAFLYSRERRNKQERSFGGHRIRSRSVAPYSVSCQETSLNNDNNKDDERFDSSGDFEVQLWQNLEAVLFPMLLDEKDAIIVIPKDPAYQFFWIDLIQRANTESTISSILLCKPSKRQVITQSVAQSSSQSIHPRRSNSSSFWTSNKFQLPTFWTRAE
jgi:hypothetical protein